MKKLLAVLFSAAVSTSALATEALLYGSDDLREFDDWSSISEMDQRVRVLPPHIQNIKDVETMLNFLRKEKNESIANGLQSISVEKQRIYYDGNCVAIFKRKAPRVCHGKGWVGPAGKLEFDRTECGHGEAIEE